MNTARAAQSEKKASLHKLVNEKAVEVVTVGRYWPGKEPKFIKQDVDDEPTSGAFSRAPVAPVDRRLQRLAAKSAPVRRRDSDSDDDDEDAAQRRRRAGATVLQAASSSSSGAAVLERGGGAAGLERGAAPRRPAEDDFSEEDDDEVEARRERLRAVQRQRRQQEAEEEAAAASRTGGASATGGGGGVGEEGGEEESEYETDTDASDSEEEEEGGRGPMLKPMFVSAEARETIKERERQEAQEEAAREQRAQRLLERQVESKQMLIEAVRREEEGNEGTALEFGDMPDDNDEVDELDEFDTWKVRELQRVRRERAERDAEAKERAELERRRNLSDAERAKEDEAFRAQRADAGQDKGAWKFLQKYYHKGAYFQDEDESGNNRLGPVMMQDFGAATGNDRVGDKSTLPAPMQVKNFGMRSQVKWTHLGKEDTMSKDKDRPMWAEDKRLAQKFERKGAGTKAANDFDRPSAKRKKA